MKRRNGFTITELLVAMALIVFIMYILAEAFSAGSAAFRNLKAIGDMNEKLRNTSQTLRRLLQADHFDGRRRVSDPDFWKDGPPTEGFLRIYNGTPFDFAGNANPRYYSEGTDLDGNVSYRATDHGLHFTVKQRGNNRGDFFRASVPPDTPAGNSPLQYLPLRDTRFQDTANVVTSSWGEVGVFMIPSGDLTENADDLNAAPQALHTLFLRNRACVPDNDVVTQAATQLGMAGGRISAATTATTPGYAGYVEMSCHIDPNAPNSVLYFNGPADLTMPGRRMGRWNGSASDVAGSQPMSGAVGNTTSFPPFAYEPARQDGTTLAGNDVLLTNVLSFEVKVLLDRRQWNAFYVNSATPPMFDFVPLSHPAIQQFSQGNTSFSLANQPRVFDTWSQSKDDFFDYGTWATPNTAFSVPLYSNANRERIRLVALQITIRIWDSNTKQTRQTSVVVDL